LNAADDPPIGPLARHDGGAAFDEPWQAQVLALAFALAKADVFTPVQWSDALGAELRRAAERGEADDQTTYYAAALAALEGLIAADGRVSPGGLSSRTEQWRRAYLNTPHGKPVKLSAGSKA
jgi:nitrile hydratase accessory protein